MRSLALDNPGQTFSFSAGLLCAATQRHATDKARNSPLETESGKTGSTFVRPSSPCKRNSSKCVHNVESGIRRTKSPVHRESAGTVDGVNRICPSAEMSIRQVFRIRSPQQNPTNAMHIQEPVTATLDQKARSDTIPKPSKAPASTIHMHMAPTIASNRRDGFTMVDTAMDMEEN